ncbi:hypothetical protein HK405_006206, partial [Cladochytrium tenue]
HDPVVATSYFEPSWLGAPNLRANRGKALWTGRDGYDEAKILTWSNSQVDHKTEKQIFAFGLRSLIKGGVLDLEAARDSVDNLNNIVDWDGNLTFTVKNTNTLKGQAVTKFLDDSTTGHRRSSDDLTAYLLSSKLERHVTAEIRKQMKVALRDCIYKLDDERTTTMEALAAELQDLFATMRLNN